MPLMNAAQLEPEEQRKAVVEDVLLTPAPTLPGFKLVRHITPLVMTALHRANNPFITGQKGFEAMGVQFDAQGQQLTSQAEFGPMLMPKTAEALVLLSCDRETLKRYTANPVLLESAALDILEELTLEQVASATEMIAQELQAVSKSRATLAPEETAPQAEALGDGTKKLLPTG